LLKLNSLKARKEQSVIVKRRSRVGTLIARLANAYFRFTGTPIRYHTDPKDWVETEVSCFNLLNAPARAFSPRPREICVEKLPGCSLEVLTRNGRLTASVLCAAARELRRAHALWLPQRGELFTHGDACLCNFIYEPSTERVRLIDFELCHAASLSARERRADDLAVFLVDLISLEPSDQWLPYAFAFLDSYDDPEIHELLPARLARPRGMARILWTVRTNFARASVILPRLALVRRILALQSPAAAGAFRPQRVLPSARGHAASAGSPKQSSRARRAIARAMAPSAEMPSIPPTTT
jgi:hypothetical protein